MKALNLQEVLVKNVKVYIKEFWLNWKMKEKYQLKIIVFYYSQKIKYQDRNLPNLNFVVLLFKKSFLIKKRNKTAKMMIKKFVGSVRKKLKILKFKEFTCLYVIIHFIKIVFRIYLKLIKQMNKLLIQKQAQIKIKTNVQNVQN